MSSQSFNDAEMQIIREKVAQGDQHAFRDLFHFFSKKLTLFAFSIVRSGDAAREIVDEVFIRIWKNRETIMDIRNLRVYLYTATKNTALNYLASRARENFTEPFDFFSVQLADELSPEKKLITSELLKKIHDAIDSLPPRCKMVFKLVREDGLSYREVGQILNISTKTVDAQMVIAIRQISDKVRMDFDYFPKKKPGK